MNGIKKSLEEKSKSILGEREINLRSSQQLAKVLIEDLGVPETKKTKTGYTMNASTLEDLLSRKEQLNEKAVELIKIVLEHREFSKIKSKRSQHDTNSHSKMMFQHIF